ncbi:MAG: urate hydroxylase PuuD [Roseateles asaccharophilus]|uniref:Putative membrane protein n=1 Tax=Roseateles asaccharophilus TaxID=582607 RepID=A0A4R6MYY4_9BURK|nr:urate hydroxylase PuuD [Roseateles asaccharophilus]MDN3545667.1 urate hydroxylase PuuD [Roseateles asaccharophilus]TDP07536.1 putative membrane protein [Roseateles asaccharophilus]
MEPSYLLDWANLLLRWLHVIVAIAWIGASFYFVWLDNHLLKPEAPELKAKGVDGELWAVHGGGFYNPQKYMVAPPNLPQHLHWFYWESYWTWMSGFALFVLLYLFNAESFLIDRQVHAWAAPWQAVLASLGFLAAGWLVYDQICRRFGHKQDGSIGNDGRVLGLIAVFIAFAAWAACQLFAGRAAFLIVGAMIATMMSANVFFWIIPGQKQVIADMRAGRPVNPIYGQRGKQRSVHNTYFTLPVLIAMLSNHYGQLYSHAHNWLALLALMLVGVLVRTWFVKRHKGVNAWPLIVAALAVLAGLILALAPAPRAPVAASAPVPTLAQVQAVIEQRCVMCHNAQLAQKGMQLHTPELVEQHAQQIYQQTVQQRSMPLNNATQITEEERALLGRWFEARAR